MDPAFSNDGAGMALLPHHPSRRKVWIGKIGAVHGRMPGINKLPLKVLGTIGTLVLVNIVVWVGFVPNKWRSSCVLNFKFGQNMNSSIGSWNSAPSIY